MSRNTPRTESGRSLRRVLADRSRSLALAGGVVTALGLAVAAASPAVAALPTNYYVAPNGTDTTGSCPANSPSNAFPTIQDAVACAVSGDVIVLAATNGTPYPGIGTVSQNITIIGAGARSTDVDISNSPLTVPAGSQVTVTGVSLAFPASAVPASFQPNVINNGALSLNSDMVTGNIYSPGIVSATTNANTPAQLLLNDTAVTGNDDLVSVYLNGGGIFEKSGSLFVQNSTIADNDGYFSGGGIWLQTGTATLTNSTVADNQALGGGGGGIATLLGTFTLSNTLVAGNTSTSGNTTVASDCSGTLADGFGGSNLIGAPVSGAVPGGHCTGLTNGTNGDQIGVASPGVASAPGNNGGPTDTVALQAGSPAIGTANAVVCETGPINDVDQRGDARNTLTRDACDIGAYDTGGN